MAQGHGAERARDRAQGRKEALVACRAGDIGHPRTRRAGDRQPRYVRNRAAWSGRPAKAKANAIALVICEETARVFSDQ
jgi:hypothetical protein